jgi:hypothetical protein
MSSDERISKQYLRQLAQASCLLIVILMSGPRCEAQWRELPLRQKLGDFVGIYFLDKFGLPDVGFIGTTTYDTAGFLGGIFKTTDAGNSWRRLDVRSDVFDFDFKDASVGWAGTNADVFKTTDGGETWRQTNSHTTALSIEYCPESHGLFINGAFSQNTALVSWDEGETWVRDGPYKGASTGPGLSFWQDGVGVFCRYTMPWQRTTDGGHTWADLAIDSTPVFEPLAVRGTSIGYGLTLMGNVLKTEDQWTTWSVAHVFPYLNGLNPPGGRFASHLEHNYTSGCMIGTYDSVYALLPEGPYLSTDSGVTWKYLCGVASTRYSGWYSQMQGNRHFYKTASKLYISTLDTDDVARLWVLDFDSLHTTGFASARFRDGGVRASTSPGDDVEVYYSNTTTDSNVASDSAHFIVRYDSESLRLKNVSGENGWQIVSKTNPSAGSLDVWLQSNGTLTTLPILSTTFSTILSDTTAKVYLEEPVIYSHRKNCDCEVTNNPSSDSVTIDFTGCGGPTLWHFMQTGQIFDLLSVSPNPAANALNVEVAERGDGAVKAEVMDLLGATRVTRDIPAGSTRFDISSLPSGTYFLRLSESGEVRTRRFVVSR